MASHHLPQTLFDWFDDLFRRLFFQPDDSIATEAFNNGFSKTFEGRINHNHLDYAAFASSVPESRVNKSMTLQSHVELVTFNTPLDSTEGGSIAVRSAFTIINNETGEEQKRDIVIIIVTKFEDGERRIAEWTEVIVDL
ncbi:hypothetical protein F5884DRAFT_776889 [Xylogone sp. PMI_703]|nr:hypothetical protein F5884DRAFT_776889 [Xylogone sp. PMI_703]